MTVSSTTSRVSYAGNGSTTAFAVPFYFLDNAHLKVILRSSTGVETVQVITTNYTVTGAGVLSGGTVTMLVAPATGVTLVIIRNVPATQLADYVQNDPFPAETHERALDKLTMIAQQIGDSDGRAMRLYDTDTEPGGRFNARLNRITGVINQTTPDASEAITYGWLANYIAGVLTGGSAMQSQVWFATGDGATTGFDLTSATLTDPVLYTVTLDGLDQRPTTDYTIATTSSPYQVSFGAAPANGVKIMVRALAVAQTVTIGAFDASAIISGVFDPARLGTGTANASKFLRGDSTWSDTLQGSMAITGVLTVASIVASGTIVGQIDGSSIVTGQIAPGRLGGGVPSVATFLRGDGQWAVPPSGGGGGSLPVGGTAAEFLRGDGIWSNTIAGPLVCTDTFDAVGTIQVTNADAGGGVAIFGNVQAGVIMGDLAHQWYVRHDSADNALKVDEYISGTPTQQFRIETGGHAYFAGPVTIAGQLLALIHASSITVGVIDPARLGSGAHDATKYLAGDGSWAALGAGLGTAVDDPLGLGYPTTSDNKGFFRGDGKFTYALQSGLIAAGSALTSQYVYMQQAAARALVSSSKNDYTVYYPITFVKSPVDVTDVTGTRFTDNEGADVLSGFGRVRALRLRSNGAPYRKMQEASTSGAISVDANASNYFKLTIVGNSTITLSDGGSDPTNGEVFSSFVDIELISVGASTITWAAAVGAISWVGNGSAPTLSALGSNLLRFTRRQGTTGWVGYLVNAQGGAGYTDEQAQDAVGTILTDSSTIDFTYTDATPSVSAIVKAGSITASELAAGAVTSSKIGAGAVTSAAIAAAAVTASAIAPASVAVSHINASGSPSSLTYFRGDGSWATPPSGGGGIAGIDLLESGVTKQAAATKINFVGATVTPAFGPSPPTVTITAPSAIYYNVRTYGALGDRVHDDTSAINAAYAAAKAAGGGTVYFPHGHYRVTSTLVWDANVNILGEGHERYGVSGDFSRFEGGTTIYWDGALGGTVIRNPSYVSGYKWEGLHIHGGASNFAAVGIELKGTQFSTFSRISIINCSSVCLLLLCLQADNQNIMHNTFDNLDLVGGQYFPSGAENLTCIPLKIETDPTELLANCCYNMFNNVLVQHANIGVWVGGSDTNTFTSLHVYHRPSAPVTGGVCKDVYLRDAASGAPYNAGANIANVFVALDAEVYAGTYSQAHFMSYSRGNGARDPFIGTGAQILFTDNGASPSIRMNGMSIKFDTGINDIVFVSPAAGTKALASL